MRVIDLSILDYRSAWREQERVHDAVREGAEEAILLVEHPPVITFGRRAAESASHLVASQELLAARGVEIVESDRGGDITFHGPGQLVAYPIVRLADHRLSVGAYVKVLEHAVIDTLARFEISAELDPGAIGVWTRPASMGSATLEKICALGVRIKGGVSMHGVALNVTTDLSYFNLIVPCGLSGRPVTSMRAVLGERCPTMGEVKTELAGRIEACLARASRHNAAR
ncbi:MAG: lipoyl(octanoyl) transferase LipB [Tepidisphaeraceae bacterium]